MRIFVTGSTGFVGTALVKELLAAGHSVLGLTRSDKGVEQLKAQGAEALVGTIEDLDLLAKAASECDGVAHLAFVHDFANFEASCATDRAAITALGNALAAAGGNKPLVISSGTMMFPSGKLATEDTERDTVSPLASTRGLSETLCLDFAKKGVRSSVVRLPPTTHGPGSSGFMSMLIPIALEKGISAYVGDGQNHWSAGHRDDAAKVYRLALEKGQAGSFYHAVAEQGVLMKDIATEIGKQLGLPVQSITADKVPEHFGWFAFGPTADNLVSSAKTKELLGWEPTGPGLIEDIAIIAKWVKSQKA